MKKKRKSKHILIILGTLSLSLLPLLFSDKTFIFIRGLQTHGIDCQWNHYSKLDETKNNNGCKEYWICCSHHEMELIKPISGTIKECGTPSVNFANSLSLDDPRVLLSYQNQANVLDSKINKLPSDEKLTFSNFENINEINSIYNQMNEETKAMVTCWNSFSATSKLFNTRFSSLFNAESDLFINRIYQTTAYSITRGSDSQVSSFITLNNITGSDTFWINPNSSVSFSQFKKVYFYVRSSKSLYIEFREKSNYEYKFTFASEPNKWSLISFEPSKYNLEIVSDIGFAIWSGKEFAFDFSISFSSIIGENQNDNFGKTKLFDASTDSIKYINYKATFNSSRSYESKLGFDYIECSNINNTEDGLWLGFDKASSVVNYSYIYFYFKCSIDIGVEIREHHYYYINETKTIKANQWTKIVIPVSETMFHDGILTDIGVDNWGHHTPETAGKWSFSSVFGVEEFEVVSGFVIPKITSEKIIDFTAYSMAPGRNKTDADNNFKTAKEAGFTKAIGLLEGRNSTLESQFSTNVQAYLNNKTETNKNTLFKTIDNFCSSINSKNNMVIESAYDNGIKYYALNCILYDFRNFVGSCTYSYDDYEMIVGRILDKSEFIKNDKFFGLFYMDEPAVGSSFEYQKRFYNKFKTITDKEALLNLLPMNEPSEKTNYSSYISDYLSDLYDYNQYISYDDYPILKSGIKTSHLLNLEIVANALKTKSEYNLRTFIYSLKGINSNSAHAGIDSVEDLSLQIYSNLAFGSSDIAYFVYSSNTDYNLTQEEDKTDGLINVIDYSKSKTYDFAKSINNEVHSFEKAYRHFSWDKILTKGSCTQFSNLQTKVSSYGKLTNVSANENTLIGCFKDQGKHQGFLITNYQNTNESTDVGTITLTFSNSTHAIMYKDGTKTVLPLTNNKISFSLNAAHGAFIIPINLN